MRLLLLLIFMFSCSNLNNHGTKKIYICGDHPCANKKEVNSYFENNISIGKELSIYLNVNIDDKITVMSPAGIQTLVGTLPKQETLKIISIFSH